jgi:lysophospholipid acyltransferase (LPLAT)-like uncharacterized protein
VFRPRNIASKQHICDQRPDLLSSLRKRLEHSRFLAGFLARLVGGYLRLCNVTTKWQIDGLDDLKADLAVGPVLLVMWHERSIMGPVHWPVKHGQLSSLYARSAVGRVSGAMQRQFGLQPMEMSDKTSNVAASRQILRRVQDGISIGMTGDGPLGPALLVKDAPLDWARAMQRPVYTYAFATKRHRRLDAWDNMVLPLPFSEGAIVFQRWDNLPPRKVSAEEIALLRDSLSDQLNLTNAVADRLSLRE